MGWEAAAPYLASAGATALGSIFGNKGSQTSQLPAMSPEQTDFLSQFFKYFNIKDMDIGNDPMFKQASDQLMKMLNGDTADIEAPLMQQYENEILPGIAQRFGGLGAQSSSGYQNAMAGAGGNLAAQLGGIRYGAKQSALDKILQYSGARNQGKQNMANMAMNAKPFGYETQTPKNNFYDYLGAAGSQGMGHGLARLFNQGAAPLQSNPWAQGSPGSVG